MKTLLITALSGLLLSLNIYAQNLIGGGEANPNLVTNKASLEKWKQLKFGLFVHWGPVSLRGTEIGWSRGREVPFDEYDNLFNDFNPILFDAANWISTLKKAGMKYLIMVTKHHDGFVMWDSKTTDYDIMSTPIKRDLLKEISDECQKQGILFGTYYSICDWRHQDYPVEQNNPERREQANLDRYIKYMKDQIKELVETYHTRILWFDGEWEDPWTHDLGMDLYKYVRSLDNNILINNRVDKGREGMEGISKSNKYAGDFATPEQQVGRYDPQTPWESRITICNQWAWKPNDEMKSYEECIHTLVRTAGGDGNLLFNVAPMLDGRIEKRQIDRLLEMGEWLKKYGETIYNTRGGPIPPQDWGVSTHTGNTIFLHILEKQESITINEFPQEISNIQIYPTGEDVSFKKKKIRLTIELPEFEMDLVDLVLEVQCK